MNINDQNNTPQYSTPELLRDAIKQHAREDARIGKKHEADLERLDKTQPVTRGGRRQG